MTRMLRNGLAAIGLLGALGMMPGEARAQARATQVSCSYAVTATNSNTRPMGSRATARFALFNQSGTVQQYNSTSRQWVRWTVQNYTPQRISMTSPSATAGCNMAAEMNRSSGQFRLSLRCANRTSVDYVGSCTRAAAAPAQRF